MIFQGLSGKESICSEGDAGDVGSIPGSGRSPGGGNSNPLLHSSLKNLMGRGAWWVTVHGVTKELEVTQQLNGNDNVLTNLTVVIIS